jgi:hypothetical protein
MAKQRYVNTKFWSDTFISELNPLDRYLFLYFLTNEHTNIAGVYELPLKTISFETGIELDMLKKMLKRLIGKVVYVDGWVCIKNFQKHQSTESEKVKRGIEIEMSKIPDNIRKKIDYGYPIDTSPRPIIYSNSNSNVDYNTNSNTKEIVASDKSVFGEFKNVKLTLEEYEKLVERFTEKNTLILIEELSGYIASKRKNYASHYATLLNWGRRKIQDYKEKTNKRTII